MQAITPRWLHPAAVGGCRRRGSHRVNRVLKHEDGKEHEVDLLTVDADEPSC